VLYYLRNTPRSAMYHKRRTWTIVVCRLKEASHFLWSHSSMTANLRGYKFCLHASVWKASSSRNSDLRPLRRKQTADTQNTNQKSKQVCHASFPLSPIRHSSLPTIQHPSCIFDLCLLLCTFVSEINHNNCIKNWEKRLCHKSQKMIILHTKLHQVLGEYSN